MWMYDAHIWKIRERKAIRQHKDTPQNPSILFWLTRYSSSSRDRPRFFDQVGYQITNASIRNKHFFAYQTYQNYEQPCQRSQNSEFQSHFSVSKIGWIFSKKKFCEECLLRRPTYINETFWKLLLKMGLIFVGSVHNFGKSDDDII